MYKWLCTASAEPLLSGLLKIATSAFFVCASFFLLTFTYTHYLAPSEHTILTATSTAASSPSTGPLDSSDTLLAVLGIVIAFAGFLAYVFKEVVQTELKQELQKMSKRESLRSIIGTQLAKTMALIDIALYDGNDDNVSQVYGTLELLEKASELAKATLDLSDQLDLTKKEDQILRIKCGNNRAFILAIRSGLYPRLLRGPLTPQLKEQLEDHVNAARAKKYEALALSEKALEQAAQLKDETWAGRDARTLYYICMATRHVTKYAFCDDKAVLEAEARHTLSDDLHTPQRVKEGLTYNWRAIFGIPLMPSNTNHP